jgi:hypothetical protein
LKASKESKRDSKRKSKVQEGRVSSGGVGASDKLEKLRDNEEKIKIKEQKAVVEGRRRDTAV